MAILTEGPRKAEFMISEAGDYRSRDEVTVTVPDGGYDSGTVLGKITATGKYVRHAAGAADGSQIEAGILFDTIANDTGSGVDHTATIIARDAQVKQADLTYEVGADATQITTSNAALAALGIVVR